MNIVKQLIYSAVDITYFPWKKNNSFLASHHTPLWADWSDLCLALLFTCLIWHYTFLLLFDGVVFTVITVLGDVDDIKDLIRIFNITDIIWKNISVIYTITHFPLTSARGFLFPRLFPLFFHHCLHLWHCFLGWEPPLAVAGIPVG